MWHVAVSAKHNPSPISTIESYPWKNWVILISVNCRIFIACTICQNYFNRWRSSFFSFWLRRLNIIISTITIICVIKDPCWALNENLTFNRKSMIHFHQKLLKSVFVLPFSSSVTGFNLLFCPCSFLIPFCRDTQCPLHKTPVNIWLSSHTDRWSWCMAIDIFTTIRGSRLRHKYD